MVLSHATYAGAPAIPSGSTTNQIDLSAFPTDTSDSDEVVPASKRRRILRHSLPCDLKASEPSSESSSIPLKKPVKDSSSQELGRRTVAKFLVHNMFMFQGCDALQHSSQLAKLKNEIRLYHTQRDDLQPVLNIKELLFQVEQMLETPVHDIFRSNSWTPKKELPQLSPTEWEKLMTGVGLGDSTNRKAPKVSLLASHCDCQSPRDSPTDAPSIQTNFDIDSILAIPTSLGIARQGINVNMFPLFVQNITSNLHVRIPVQTSSSHDYRSIPLHHIPHFKLGNICSHFQLDLFLFLPGLFNPDAPTNFPAEVYLEQFFDQLWLPALGAVGYPADLVQHLPNSFKAAKRNALAATKANTAFASGRPRIIHHYHPTKFLEAIWSYILQKSKEPGLHHFQNLILFINSKNLKTMWKNDSPMVCFESFLDAWKSSCNLDLLDRQHTWIDYGKETIYPRVGLAGSYATPIHDAGQPHVKLWRTCCLDAYVKRLRTAVDMPEGGIEITKYQFAMTSESYSLTIAPTHKNSLLAQAGLRYSQFYSSTKEIFDSAKIYPFTDELLEALAIDPYLKASIISVGGGRSVNRQRIANSYFESRDRSMESLKAGTWKSYGIREEHRVSLDLLNNIYQELKDPIWIKPYKALKSPTPIIPYLLIPTNDLLAFLTFNIVRFALPFEYMTARKYSSISMESSKLRVMLLRCIKLSYNSSPLQRYSAIWKTTLPANKSKNYPERQGMGLQNSLQKCQFGWLASGMINFNNWRFVTGINTGFSDNAFVRRYKSRWALVDQTINKSNERDRLAPLMLKYRNDKGRTRMIFRYLRHQCIRSYNSWIWRRFQDDLRFHDDQDRDYCLLGSTSLSYDTFGHRLKDSTFWSFPKTRHSKNDHLYSTPESLASFIWDLDSPGRSQWSNSAQYLTDFESCCRHIHSQLGADAMHRWRIEFLSSWLKYTWVFPKPRVDQLIFKERRNAEGKIRKTQFVSIVSSQTFTNGWSFVFDPDTDHQRGTPPVPRLQSLDELVISLG